MNWIREFSFAAVAARMFIAMLLGGILGLERGLKKRPAGFRTYMLVCVGSALVMATSQYVLNVFNTGDPARLGAQVISGIGFLGAGTIIVTGRNQVKGLTTAAGLWAAACLGLAVGIGYAELAVLSFIMMYITLAVFHRLDNYILRKSKVMELFIEFVSPQNMTDFVSLLREKRIKVTNIEITRNTVEKAGSLTSLMTVVLPKKQLHGELITFFSSCEGVSFIEEY